MEGKYLYGIVHGSNGEWGPIGLDSYPVVTISYDSLGAVVSDYKGKEFAARPREELIHCLLAHQAVVEGVMERYPVLPIKFGTVLANIEEVGELLHQGYPRLVQALAQIKEKVEIEVAATWNRQEILRELSREEEVRQWKEFLQGNAANLEQQAKLGKVIIACLERRRDGYQKQVMDFLHPLALEAQPNPLLSDDLVMNVAFLVDRRRRGEFDRRVTELDELFGGRINFRVIGPLPPYTFSTVEVSQFNQEKISEARKALGLDTGASAAEVRRAYRKLAIQVHPDLNPGEGAPTRFAQLREATELLLAYCQGGGEGHLYSVKNCWLISIKGSRQRRESP